MSLESRQHRARITRYCRRLWRACGAGVAILALVTVAAAADPDGHWPSFRGPAASGVADGHATPTTWNVKAGENIQWKTPIPGLGLSSPVVWGDRVFVTTAISGKAKPKLKVGLYGDIEPVRDNTVHRYVVYCLDRTSGKILWERTAHEGVPRTRRHPKSSHANPSVATDGKRVVAPVIHGGRVIVLADVLKGSFLAAFDVQTGKEIWRRSRDDYPTWGTPTVHESGGRAQVIVNGYKQIAGYDFKTGDDLWNLHGGGDIPVPTPIVAHDLIFITNAHGGAAPIYAIRTTARGDISLAEDATSNEHIAWSSNRQGGYMQTPIVYGDLLYVCRDNGVLGCYKAKTGEELYRERLGGGKTGFTASAVAADGKIYVTSETGDVLVLRAGPKFELLATNSLGEVTMATPAISEGTLLFRTQHHLIAVGSPKEKPGT